MSCGLTLASTVRLSAAGTISMIASPECIDDILCQQRAFRRHQVFVFLGAEIIFNEERVSVAADDLQIAGANALELAGEKQMSVRDSNRVRRLVWRCVNAGRVEHTGVQPIQGQNEPLRG